MFGVCVGGFLVVAGVATLLHHRCGCRHRLALGCALRRLRATKEQREQIKPLVERAVERLRAMRNKVDGLRSELADAVTSEPLDNGRLERLEAGLFEATGEFSQILRETVTQLHQVLDAEQRAKLGKWLVSHHHCHGHRCHGHSC